MKLKDVWLKSLQDKEFAKLEKIKKLDLLKKDADLSPSESTFSNMLSKLPVSEGAKVEWTEDQLTPYQPGSIQKFSEHKKALEETLFYGVNHDHSAAIGSNNSSNAADAWWTSTNDPKLWSSGATWNHAPALSVSASWSSSNYTQIFAAPHIVDAIKNYKPKMTRELAIAMNNGEVY